MTTKRSFMRLGIVGAVGLVVAGVVMRGAASSTPSVGDRARVSPSSRESSAAPVELLPDLDQETPAQLMIRTGEPGGGSRYKLGFRSAVRNIGTGPLIVNGARPDTKELLMRVDQLIQRAGRRPRVVRDVGRMKYTISPDHRHWHYLQFDRYELVRWELRRVGSTEPLVADRKTGFCLGDRYRVRRTPRAAPARPVYTGRCGLEQPGLLRMREGISVGYGDDYSAFLEGQDLPLDGLGDGRYVLVHRVNATGQLRELSYANNAASVLLDLRWRQGIPRMRVLATCPDSDSCGLE